MKSRLPKLLKCSCTLLLALCALAPRALAQTVGLDIHLYAGITITGAVGAVYAIQATTNPAQSNGWSSLTVVPLLSNPYLWVDTSAPASGRRFYRAVATGPSNTVFIRPGMFVMGAPPTEVDYQGDEGPQTTVTLARGFYIGKYLVTQEEYAAVVGSNPSSFPGDTTLPVETVSWDDATNYCALRTAQEQAAGLIPTGWAYRLPTEAEWEFTCRAGTSTRFFYGDDPGYTNLANYAWYYVNSSGTTHGVGLKTANPWGLYDMGGNVWEWCQDWYGNYSGGEITDPQGPCSGTYRVVRGGSWLGPALLCRSASRDSLSPGARLNYYGFRVVLAQGQ